MADNFTFVTFITSWKAYQDHLAEALATLTAEQLALRAAPGLRSVGENVLHIMGCRVYWFTEVLGEDGGADAAIAVERRATGPMRAGTRSAGDRRARLHWSRTGPGPRPHLAA